MHEMLWSTLRLTAEQSDTLTRDGIHGKPTIVSITPIRAESDSRSIKIASSFARFGYRAILVEGEESGMEKAGLQFELLSIRKSGARRPEPQGLHSCHSNRHGLSALRTFLSAQLRGTLLEDFMRLFLFLVQYLRRSVLAPLKHIPRASLYYLHEFTLFPAVRLLCLRYGAHLIYDAHDSYSTIRPSWELERLSFSRRWILTFLRYVESRAIAKAQAVVTVSDGIARLQHEMFGSSPIVLRNVHDSRLDRQPPRDIRTVLKLSSDRFLLVTVGNAKEGMAVKHALDAMLEIPSRVHLAFLGRSYEQYVQETKNRGLENRVHFIQPVDPREIVPFIRTADASLILYFPLSLNYKYCLPNGFFQSLAAGLTLLYPDLPEIRNLAERFDLGIPVDPQSTRSIVSTVTRLAGDNAALARHARNSSSANKFLNWEREEQALRKLVHKVMADSGRN